MKNAVQLLDIVAPECFQTFYEHLKPLGRRMGRTGGNLQCYFPQWRLGQLVMDSFSLIEHPGEDLKSASLCNVIRCL